MSSAKGYRVVLTPRCHTHRVLDNSKPLRWGSRDTLGIFSQPPAGVPLTHRDLPNLDLLRSVAVISVVVEHTLLAMHIGRIGSWQVAWIGVVGVFMFFVHTSLVLMWSLERKPNTLDFYIRRAFRIYPLAWAAILIAVLFHLPTEGTPLNYFHYAHFSGSSLVSALLLVQNFYGHQNFVGVLWSLPYEVQMYLFLPVLFFFVQKNFSVWYLLVLWSLTVVFCRVTFSSDGHNLATVIPYFLPGVMAYVGFDRTLPRMPSWTFPVFLLSLTAAFMRHPGWFRAWLFCLALGIGLPFFHQIRSHRLRRVSVQVAQYSYSLYLVHPFAIVLGFYLLAQHTLAIRVAVEILTLVPISIASYHWVERPMIRLGARLAVKVGERTAARA